MLKHLILISSRQRELTLLEPIATILYVKQGATLFNVKEDPDELYDLAADPKYAQVLKDFKKLLFSIYDPEETSLRAKRDYGLIGPDGEDYTETLTYQELLEGQKSGKFPPNGKWGYNR